MADAGQVRRLLATRDFRELYVSRLTSQVADGIFQASLVSYVLFSPERATSATAIAGSLAIVLLPFSLIGPFTGIVLDRASRQRVLIVSSLVRAGLLAVLTALIAAGHTGPDFYAAALSVFSVSRFVLSALSAGLPVVSPPDDLVTANALSTTSGTGATLVGAGLGSGLRGLVGAGDSTVAVVAAVAGVAYLLAAITAGRAGKDAYGPVDAPGWKGALAEFRRIAREMAAGAKHLYTRPRARDALVALTAFRFCYGLLFVGLILLYRNTFTGHSGGLAGLAVVVGASGVGTITAAFVTPKVTEVLSKQAWIALTIGGSGVAVVALGLPFSPGLFAVAAVILGFCGQGAKICVDTFVQSETDDAFRGRAFSIYDLMFNLAYVAAAGVAALTLPSSGRSPVMIGVVGGGFVLTAATYTWEATRHARRLTEDLINRS